MSITNEKKPQDTNGEAHTKFVTWLDAYVTDELDEREKAQLEQHIEHCAECQQWLVDIRRLRTLLKAHGTSIQKESGAYAAQTPSPSCSQSILTAIANDHNSADSQETLEPSVARQQWTVTLSGQKNVTKRPYLRLIGVLVAALCIFVLVFALLPQLTQLTTFSLIGSTQPHSRPIAQEPATFWQLDEKQTVMRNGSDIFSVKSIEGTAQGFRIFYAFSSPQAEEVPQIEVISLLPSQPGSTTHLATHIQSLGKLGAFNVGVIQVAYLDRVGQTIVIQGTSAKKTTDWSLSPLKQLNEESSVAGGWFFVDQNNLPDITWFGPFGEKIGVAYFQNAASSQDEAAHLYLRLGDSIMVITQAEFLQLSGKNSNEPSCANCPKPLSVKNLLATGTAVAKETATAGATNKK
jgi:ribosomal protein L34E